MVKQGITRELIALRIIKEFGDGMYVNLGVGLPTLIQSFLTPELDIMFHSESGVIGCGQIAEPEEWDNDLINAGAQPIVVVPGASFFDATYAFGIMRGGHIDLTVLGAYQVSEKGDLANSTPSKQVIGGIGGAMDVACGAKRVFVAMEHVDRQGNHRIVKECTLTVTAREVVDMIFTDLAVIKVTEGGLVLKEIAPEFTVEEVQEVTEAKLIIDPELKIIQF